MDIRSNNPMATHTVVNRNRRRWTLVGGVIAAGCLTFGIGAVIARTTSEPANQSLGAAENEVDQPAVVDIAEGEVDVPVATTSPALVGDADDGEVDVPTDASDGSGLSIDGFDIGALVDPGTHEMTALGTPLTLSFEAGWVSPRNIGGHTEFGRPDSIDGPDPSVVFFRPHALANAQQPQDPTAETWPLGDIDGWLDEIVDGIVTSSPQSVEIGGRDSIYFEAEITDPAICGPVSWCAGFIANTYEPGPENGGEGVISGWGFLPGLHHRIWWIDQGAEAPLVIIAVTPTTDRTSQTEADALLDTLTIGDPQPHPVPFEQSGLTG